MKTLHSLLSSFLILLLFSNSLFASHIIGGEMSYVCLGNNEYEITLKVFRDCYNGQAAYDDPTCITIFDGSGNLYGTPLQVPFPGSDTLENVASPCLVIPPGICVEEADFVTTVTLPPGNGYTMVYERCCRNMIIANIDGPDSHGTAYVATIPDSTSAICNSSPYFNNFPPTLICVDQPFSFDHSATDPDGDLLVYHLCPAYDGGQDYNVYPCPANTPPYSFVPYLFPFSADDPMGGNPSMTIDSLTGILSVTPQTTGDFIVAVCVDEYRNGIFLGEHKRDFQFNVVLCGILLTVDFDALDGIVNQPIQFTDQTTTDSGYVNSWSWDFGDGAGSTDQNPIYTYQAAGAYAVTLTVTTSAGCVGEHLQTVHVSYASGISSPEFSFSNQPAKLYDLYGQQQSPDLIYEMKNGWTVKNDVLIPGIYFLSYQTSSGAILKKIIVLR